MIKKMSLLRVTLFVGYALSLSSCRNDTPITNSVPTNGNSGNAPTTLLPTPSNPTQNPPPAPVTLLSSSPGTYWAGETATFVFDASIPHSTFECNLDQNGFEPCISPFSVRQQIGTGGAHSLQIQATSPHRVTEASPLTLNWTHENYNTVALFHFDRVAPTTDSSLFTGELNSSMLSSTAVSSVGAPGFAEGQNFTEATQMSTPYNSAHRLATHSMTFEGFFKFNNLPSSTQLMVLASQSGSSGQYGWEFGIVRWGTNFYLYFIGSQDGITRTEVESPRNIGNLQSLVLGSWYHFAMTLDSDTGAIAFYKNGVSFGSVLFDSIGSSLFDSLADFRLGFADIAPSTSNYPNSEVGGTLRYFNGIMDEIRWSQIVRPISVPIGPLSAD